MGKTKTQSELFKSLNRFPNNLAGRVPWPDCSSLHARGYIFLISRLFPDINSMHWPTLLVQMNVFAQCLDGISYRKDVDGKICLKRLD
jgi:hypothetical protein